MTKPKPLEQLRAEKERAETQLAQEQHKLERLENRKKYLEQCVQAAISTETKKDYAAQRGRDAFGTATRISASLLRRLSAFFRSVSDQDPKAAKLAVLIPGPGMLVNVRNAPRVVIPPPSETPPVSACKPLCAILLRKPSVYPLSPVKANVGRLCERLKNAMKSGLGRSCSGNFLAIFAGTVLDEKPNFLSRIFGRGRPFDFSTR